MPATQRTAQPTSAFPSSTKAASTVAATRTRQKEAFDGCVDEIVRTVGARFTEALTKPQPGELTHVPAEKRFVVTINPDMEGLFDEASGAFSKAQHEFTDLDEDGLRTLVRAAVVKTVASQLKAAEFTHIDVKLAERTEKRWVNRREVDVTVHALHVEASCPDKG
jgi:hypothetical protein